MRSDDTAGRFDMMAGKWRAGYWILILLAVPFALLAGASVTWADQIGCPRTIGDWRLERSDFGGGLGEVSRGSEGRELKAGQMFALERGVFQPVRPLEASNWQQMVAAMEVAQGPSNIPSSPTLAPGSPSPRGFTPGTDVTQRDLPSGPLPRGGETRLSGDTFTVQSAREFTTYQEITARPVGDFQVATQVRSGGSGPAGLYVSAAPVADNQAGDFFFGMDGAGIVLQRHDGAGWRDLPRQARGIEPSVRLEVLRSGGRYEFRWNGAPVGEAADAGGPMRAFLFAGPGVRAEFSTFSVSQQ